MTQDFDGQDDFAWRGTMVSSEGKEPMQSPRDGDGEAVARPKGNAEEARLQPGVEDQEVHTCGEPAPASMPSNQEHVAEHGEDMPQLQGAVEDQAFDTMVDSDSTYDERRDHG